MTSFLCFRQRKGLKAKNVIMTSNCKFMSVFELSGPNVVSMPNFSSISLQMADFSLFFGPKFCEVPFVILLTWQRLNVMNWLDLKNVSQRCIFKIRKFQLDNLSRFRMVEENRRRAYFASPPPPPK